MHAFIEAIRQWRSLKLGRSFNLMALVIYDDACLEPSYLRFIAAGGLAHAFAARALEITVLSPPRVSPINRHRRRCPFRCKEIACGSGRERSESEWKLV